LAKNRVSRIIKIAVGVLLTPRHRGQNFVYADMGGGGSLESEKFLDDAKALSDEIELHSGSDI